MLQEHHTARDVFLTELVAEDEPDCLLRPVTVCLPSELEQHSDGDVFVCDHQYHTVCSVRLRLPVYSLIRLLAPELSCAEADDRKICIKSEVQKGMCLSATSRPTQKISAPPCPVGGIDTILAL